MEAATDGPRIGFESAKTYYLPPLLIFFSLEAKPFGLPAEPAIVQSSAFTDVECQ